MNDQLSFGGDDPLERDSEAAREAAEEGMARARRAARVQFWKTEAAAWLASLTPGAEVVADDLVSEIGLPDAGPARNNVVGAWFSAQAKTGRLVWTGKFRKSQRVVGHSNLQRVWRRA